MPRYIAILKILLILQIPIQTISCTKEPTSPIWNGTADTSWFTADTSATEFTITTAEQLAGIATLTNDSIFFKGKTIRLEQNIMLNDTVNLKDWESKPPKNKWIPIGTEKKRFIGTFDGNGFKIIGVYISSLNSSEDNQGLFGYVGDYAVIKNLGVVASRIKGGKKVGGLVGMAHHECSISNSYFNGNVIGKYQVGGLIGDAGWAYSYGCYINDSYSTGMVTGGNTVGGLAGSGENIITNSYSTSKVTGTFRVGGLVGYNLETAAIKNSYFNGDVIGKSYIGGLAGEIGVALIINSYSAGTVKGDSSVGGITGYNYGGEIIKSYSMSFVEGEYVVGGIVGSNTGEISDSYYAGKLSGNNIAGGLVAYNYIGCNSEDKVMLIGRGFEKFPKNTGEITNSYYDNELNKQSHACNRGEGKTTAEMRSKSTFKDWDFENVWSIDSTINNGYPYLRGF